MKKTAIAAALALILALCGGIFFRNELLDLLPIDQSKWVQQDGQRLHLGPKGDPDTGWFREGEDTYYLLPEAASGWTEIDGGTYHFSAEGVLDTGWYTEDADTFYLDTDGRRHTGWLDTPEGLRWFAEDGRMFAGGWLDQAGARSYLDDSGLAARGEREIDGAEYCFDEDGKLQTGWITRSGKRCYLDPSGLPHTGWLETEDGKYFLEADGTPRTGWMEADGLQYYFLEDGSAATGRHEIDGKTFFFTASGMNILLVNRWNPIPEDYEPDLVKGRYGAKVDSSCLEAMEAMLDACAADGHYFRILSSYRSYWDQMGILNAARRENPGTDVTRRVALPNTSEHQLGLALDIVENRATGERRGNNPTQRWLLEHCWDYGFIVRYPEDSSDYTGIIYEPWHFRYVGVDFALEMKEAGVCLEEYMDALTNDGTSCGGIDKK